MRRRLTALALAAGLATLAGCGGGSSTSSDPAALLRQAKASVDGAGAVHFVLTTSGSRSGESIVGGEGDLGHPDQLKGSFTVAVQGLQVPVKVASSGGKFLAQLPFTSHYATTDPSSFGIANPAQLINPNGGLSSILIEVQQPVSAGQTRSGGEVLDVVNGTVPGSQLSALPDQDPSKPVSVSAKINPSNHELRTIALTGPIGTKGQATYTVTLTNYGEHVDFALPTT